VAGVAVCAIACALLWPRARDAGAILAAQDDPAALSDVQLNAALRNNQAVIEQNIEAALAADDADLANSFVDLAKEKNVPVNDELSRRVAAAIAHEIRAARHGDAPLHLVDLGAGGCRKAQARTPWRACVRSVTRPSRS